MAKKTVRKRACARQITVASQVMSKPLANIAYFNDRLQQLHRENTDQLITLLLRYDEMNTILTAAGHDTTSLHISIKSALQVAVELMKLTHDHMIQFNLEREAETLL